MIDKNLDNKIVNIANSYKYLQIKFILNNLNEDEINYLKQRYNNYSSLSEVIYRLKNNIEEIPKCIICGKPAKFSIGKHKYINTCGNKECYRKYNRIKVKETLLDKYGVENLLQVPEFKEKFINTWHEHTQEETNKIVNKRRKYCLEHYGIDNKAKLPETINKMFNTNLEKYGHICCLRNEEIIKKCKETSLKIYGYEFPSQCPDIIDKQYKSKKEKNSFLGHTSKAELLSKQLLEKKFNNIEHQYKSSEYPFICDFYIPSLNLYIECNYFWTHGLHPFDKNNQEDINKLNKWKNKNREFFNSAIKTWTITDPLKRNTVKENNLNFIEFFNINELKDWLDKQ